MDTTSPGESTTAIGSKSSSAVEVLPGIPARAQRRRTCRHRVPAAAAYDQALVDVESSAAVMRPRPGIAIPVDDRPPGLLGVSRQDCHAA